MKTSETISKIAVALLEAQKGITFATKDATNPHFKNRYADLPAVVDAVKPALNDSGIAFIQSASPSDDSKLHLTTRLMHSSGEWIEDTLVMPLAKQDAQGFGSAMTYARRYALAAITGLYQDDDDGNAGSGVESKQAYSKPAAAAPKGLPPAALKKHVDAINAATDMEALKIVYGTAYKAAHAVGDKVAEEVLAEAKDSRKIELEVPA
jgi:ERF superfamily